MAIDPEKITLSEIEDVKSKITVITQCGVCEDDLPNPVMIIGMDMGDGNLELPTLIDDKCSTLLVAD